MTTNTDNSSMSESLPRPGLWRNLLAMIYDAFLVAPLLMANAFVLVALFGPTDDASVATVPAWLMQFSCALIIIGFFSLFWCKSGQSLGMQAWRIKLVRGDGGPVGLGRAVVRCLGAAMSLAPAGLGYWWSLVDRDGLRWHDRLSDTRLLRVPKTKK